VKAVNRITAALAATGLLLGALGVPAFLWSSHQIDEGAQARLQRQHAMDGPEDLRPSLQGAEISNLVEAEEVALLAHATGLESSMPRLLTVAITTSALLLLLAACFVHRFHRPKRQLLRAAADLAEGRSFETQEAINDQLRQANLSLRESEEKLAVTLNSIGDAVISTDAEANVMRMNPVAEQLTGWTQAEATGRPVEEVFHIINQETRQSSKIPVMATLALGTVQGLANHTILIARDGSERAIADSCAPIRDRDGRVVGAVLVFRDVTEEYAAQQALRDSTALIETILKTVVDGIITLQASNGCIETANPAAERMFGYSAAELIGRTFSTLIPELAQGTTRPSLEHYSASLEARAIGLGREVVGLRRDGSAFPLEIAASEMWLGGQRYFTGILRDVTARKQAEVALLKAGALQSAIFNSANFSSIATDASGIIQIFNVGAERMLGYAAAEVLNRTTPADFSDPDELIARARMLSLELGTSIAPGFEALVFKASRGIGDVYELTYIRKDGSRLPAEVSVTALRDPQDAIIGYLLIGTDNTERKRAAVERALLDQVLREKNAELESARFVAERANQAKSEFLSGMSHELRTPLSAILGFAQLIESGSPQPTLSQKRSIDQILKAGWYLLELINEVLDLSLIESGQLSLSMEPVSLAEVMYECQAMIEPQARGRGISLAFCRFETPYFVRADRTRVKQILINLLSNAIKYNKVGGTVSVECRPSSPDSIRISVGDTGAGLTPDQLAQLFQPFNRLGQKASIEEGTGIGLVVCKRLIDSMGGVIGVASTVGNGCVFWVELPRMSEPEATARADEPTLLAQPAVRSGAALHSLLYVEDNPANLMLVEDLVARRHDIRLLSARDGQRGIEIARATLPDVILMDINLPGISGIQALRILAEDPATAHIPVVALSANAIPRDIEKGLRAGFFRYLTKPIKLNEFMDTLDVALRFATAERVREGGCETGK